MRTRSPRTLIALFVLLVVAAATPAPAAAEQRFIVRTGLVQTLLGGPLDGVQIVNDACALAGCTVQYPLDGGSGKVFLVTTPDLVDPQAFIDLVTGLAGIEHAEIDALLNTAAADAQDIPPALLDTEPVTFYGSTVPAGYLRQPANDILGVSAARAEYGLTGHGVMVAVIDTGIDPTHPVLRQVLLDGYDFTRDRSYATELSDLDSSVAWRDGTAQPGYVNQSTIAVVDQATMDALTDSRFAAFGHGTMVAGLIHLTAPRARILPLKAFRANGAGFTSDVLRAVYFAVGAGAKVINMSFSFPDPSLEVARAIEYAAAKGVVPIAAVGNDGALRMVYPAALPEVIGVASTTDYDVLSAFSNYGTEVAWIAAPGEGVVTTFPLNTYAAAWGTSFSTSFASGTAALLAELDGRLTAPEAADAQGHATWVSSEVSRGRLDLRSAIAAWRTRLGLP